MSGQPEGPGTLKAGVIHIRRKGKLTNEKENSFHTNNETNNACKQPDLEKQLTNRSHINTVVENCPKEKIIPNQHIGADIDYTAINGKTNPKNIIEHFKKPVMSPANVRRGQISLQDLDTGKEIRMPRVLPSILDHSESTDNNKKTREIPLDIFPRTEKVRHRISRQISNLGMFHIADQSSLLPCSHIFCKYRFQKRTHNQHPIPSMCISRKLVPNKRVGGFSTENRGEYLPCSQPFECRHDCSRSVNGVHHSPDCRTIYYTLCKQCRNIYMRNYVSQTDNLKSLDHIDSEFDIFLQEICKNESHVIGECSHSQSVTNCEKQVRGSCTIRKENIGRVLDLTEDKMANLVNNLSNRFEDGISSTKKVILETEDKLRHVDTMYLETSKEVDKAINESILMLETRRKELKNDLFIKCKRTRYALRKNKERLERNLNIMISEQEFASQVFNNTLPDDLASVMNKVSDRFVKAANKQSSLVPFEISLLYFDGDKFGSSFKKHVSDMGKICSKSPQAVIETFDIGVGIKAKIMSLFLHDLGGYTQKDCSTIVEVDVYDPDDRMSSALVESSSTADGCYNVFYTAETLGQYRANVKVMGRQLNDDGYRFAAKVSGKVATQEPDCVRLDVSPSKRSTARKIKTSKSRTFPWE